MIEREVIHVIRCADCGRITDTSTGFCTRCDKDREEDEDEQS